MEFSREHTDWTLPFGEWMKRERERAELTRKQVALRVGVAQHTVERWEQGVRRPLVDVFARWCMALGIPVERGIRQLALFINRLSPVVGN